MRRARLTGISALLCVPTLAAVALGAYFLSYVVPDIDRSERARVRDEYRETASAIRQNPADYRDVTAERPSLRSPWKMAPGKWGYLELDGGDKADVWYDDGADVHLATVPRTPSRNYPLILWTGGSALLLLLVVITVFALRYFVGYVKSREDFLAAAAHDLKTPLAALRSVIDYDLGEAKDLVERLERIVVNITDFLRLGRRPAPRRDEFDLAAVCRAAYRLFALDYADERKCGEVEFALPATLPVLGDETQTIQIVWNLFGNDLKYAAPYGPVRVRGFLRGGFAALVFEDEGPGMSPRQLRRAFDRYYRAKTVLESGKGGFGIGLCNAREFARRMGGDLVAAPGLGGKGCVFTLTLPRPT